MINCKNIAKEWKEEIKKEISSMQAAPKLIIIQIGDNPASNAYVKGKLKDCQEVGVEGLLEHYPENCSKEDILRCIKYYSTHKGCVSGIIVQLPIPFSKEETQEILDSIPAHLDVDGLRSSKDSFTPCTPLGIMKILEEEKTPLEGKTALIINRSELVGRPLINLLLDKNLTVITAHSKTPRYVFRKLLSMANIIITATGKTNTINKDFHSDLLSQGSTTIIDVGISRVDGKLQGDVDPALYDADMNITPVPGGVGLMTRCALLQNTLDAHKKHIDKI